MHACMHASMHTQRTYAHADGTTSPDTRTTWPSSSTGSHDSLRPAAEQVSGGSGEGGGSASRDGDRGGGTQFAGSGSEKDHMSIRTFTDMLTEEDMTERREIQMQEADVEANTNAQSQATGMPPMPENAH